MGKIKKSNTTPWIGERNSAAWLAGLTALRTHRQIPWRELRSIMAECGPILESTASRFINAADRAGALKVTGRWDARNHRETRKVSIAPPPHSPQALKWLTVPPVARGELEERSSAGEARPERLTEGESA